MNTNLNYSVKSGSKELTRNISAACFGNYIKTGNFNSNYRSHEVSVYIQSGTVHRVNGEVKLNLFNYTTRGTRLNLEDSLNYLNYFNGLHFAYVVEEIETTIQEGYRLFSNAGELPSTLKGITDSYKYLKVTIPLKQFKTIVEAKNALFFIRNSVYTYNSFSIKTFLNMKEYVGKLDPYYLLQFGEILGKINGESQGEYSFFNRGYAEFNNKILKYLVPQSGDEYWEKHANHNKGTTVDDVLSSRFTRKELKPDEVLSLETLALTLNTSFRFNLKLSERDIKMFINKLLLISSNFLEKSIKYNNLKAEING